LHSSDSRYLLSSGADGGIFCWNLGQVARRDSSKREAIKPIISPQVLAEVQVLSPTSYSEIQQNILNNPFFEFDFFHNAPCRPFWSLKTAFPLISSPQRSMSKDSQSSQPHLPHHCFCIA
jgi:hypothetical protein